MPAVTTDIVELHRRLLVANLHDDWGIEVYKRSLAGERGALDEIYEPRVRKGGIDFSFYTIGGDDVMFTQDRDLLRGTMRAIDSAREEISLSQHFVLADNAADVVSAKKAGKVALMFALEGVAPLGDDLGFLRLLHALGMRSITLTWFKANQAGDGVGERRNGGLTNFGRDLVVEANRLGILVDISQAAPATVDDVFAETRAPVIASHSNCAGVYSHRRNLSDQQLRGLAATGGVVGLTSYPAHVGDDHPGLEEFLDHFDYAAEVAGIDHVAVGLNIVVHTADEAERFYRRSHIEFSALHLPELEDLDQMMNLTAGLIARGYSEADVEKVMGANLLRVLQALMRDG